MADDKKDPVAAKREEMDKRLRDQMDIAGQQLKMAKKYGFLRDEKMRLLKEQSEVHKLKWTLKGRGVPREEIQQIVAEARDPGRKSLLMGAFDLVMRGNYAASGMAEEFLDMVAPADTPEGERFADIYNTLQDGRRIEAQAGMAPNTLSVAMAARKGLDLFITKDGRAALKTTIQRGALAKETGALDYAVSSRLANELFSGIGDFEGEKKTFKEGFFKPRGLRSGPSVSETLSGATGVPVEDLSVPLPFTPQPEVFETTEGPVEVGGGGLIASLIGNRLGFTDTGHGILALQQDGILDFRSEDLDFFIPDVFADPITYVTGGASGIAKAAGKPITKAGMKRLAVLEVEESGRRAGRMALAGVSKDPKVTARLAQAYELAPARAVAEAQLLVEARASTKATKALLRPKGEIRFMGQPIGAVGKLPGEKGVIAAVVQDAKIEKGFNAFRKAVIKGSKPVREGSVRDAMERVGAVGRKLKAPFRAEETKLAEWLAARARSEGGVNKLINFVDEDLVGARLSKVERKEMLDAVSDPHVGGSFVPKSKGQRQVMATNDMIDDVYRTLDQEAVVGVKKQHIEDLAALMEMDNQFGFARRLRQRVAEATTIDPDAKKLFRTELFFKDADRKILKYTEHLASMMPRTKVSDLDKYVRKVAKEGTQEKLRPLAKELLDLYNLRNTPGLKPGQLKAVKNKYAMRIKQLEAAEKNRAATLMSTGSNGAVITPMSRDDFLSLLDDIKKSNASLPKLTVVDDTLEHVHRKGKQAYTKQAQEYLVKKARAMAKDDRVARTAIEENLLSAGVMEQMPKGSSIARVDDAIDVYAKAKAAGRRGASPMTEALEKVKTKDEMRLFVRKWLLGEDTLQGQWKEGTLSQRFWEAMSIGNDVDDFVEGAVKLGVPDKQMVQWANEAQALRKALKSQGLDMNDVIPRANMQGFLGPDGTKFVPFRNIVKERGRWRLSSKRAGEALYIPESLARSLQRMADDAVRNPGTVGSLAALDRVTNFVKFNLTALGGFPSFQVRNLIGNTAFGFTAAGLAFLNPRRMNLARKMAWRNTDPNWALSGAGHRNAMQMRTMQRLAITQPTGIALDVREIEGVIRRQYGSSNRAIVRKIVDDPKRLQKEAKRVKGMLDEVVIVDDLAIEHTMADILREIPKQRVDVDPRILAEFTGVGDIKYGAGMSKELRRGMKDKLLRSNAFFEQWSRQQLFMTYVARGVGYEEAGRLANKWLLDYQRLGPFEQNVMKRIFPFYTFYRKTVPLMVESLFTRPGATSLKAKLVRDPKDPVAVFGSEPGERVTIQRDGKVYIVGRVDLPIKALKFLDAVRVAIPGQHEEGKAALKDILLMIHPGVHALFGEATDFEVFQNRKVTQKKVDALGAFLDAGEGELPSYIHKTKGYDGRTHYYLDRGASTLLFNASGLTRLSSNADRIVEAVRDLQDGEVTAAVQWLTGLRPQIVNMTDSERLKVRQVHDSLVEEGVRRRILKTGQYEFEIDKVE